MTDAGPDPAAPGPPEGIGGLRRERLGWARLYFVCDALPHGDDPEPMLRAALAGGAGMVELRDREQPARRSSARRRPSGASPTPTAPSSSSTTIRTWPASSTPTASTSARTTCRRARRASSWPRGDHRPLHPLARADRGRPRPARRLHQRRADLGDADEGGRPGDRAGADPRGGRERRPALVRDRRHRHRQRRARSSRPARGGSAWCARSATPTTRRAAAAAPASGRVSRRPSTRSEGADGQPRAQAGRAPEAQAPLGGARRRSSDARSPTRPQGEPSAPRPEESFQERMAQRSEARNAEVRAGLEPLAAGRAPGRGHRRRRRLGDPGADLHRLGRGRRGRRRSRSAARSRSRSRSRCSRRCCG